MWLQNVFVSAYGLQWKQRRFGGIFSEEYRKAKERESFTAQQWSDYQDWHLQRILHHAFDHVPYYKKAFEEQNISRQSLAKLSANALSKLPVLLKEDLRRFGTSTLLSDKKEKGGLFFPSSGSTGTPTQILFSHAMHQRVFALMESRVRNWAGVNSFMPRGMIGGRRVVPNAYALPPYYRYNRAEKQVYFSAYHISKKNAQDYLAAIKKYGVQYMTGYAMSNFLLASFMDELDLTAPHLRCVITSSEKLTPKMREVFLKVYGCKTFDGWSGLENCGLVSECEQGSLHVSPDAGIIELLDDKMQPVDAGSPGRVYCTGFLNYDQPLIRYDIGDTMVASNESCACGRHMPVIREIIGRNEDVVYGKDGRAMVRFHSIFNGLRSIKQAQVIQESTELIRIKVVPDGNVAPQELVIMKDRIRSQLGDVDVLIQQVETIDQTKNGKFKAVISRL